MDTISFRLLRESDMAFITELLNDIRIIAALHNAVRTYGERLDIYREYWAPDETETHFVIYLGDNPVGWMKLNGLDDIGGTAWISMLAVSPDKQRRGIGRAAVSFAEGFFRDRGYANSGIHTTDDNITAQGLYSSCGYKMTERGDCTTEDGTARIGCTFMKKL